MGEWINKLWYTLETDYYLTMKKKKKSSQAMKIHGGTLNAEY